MKKLVGLSALLVVISLLIISMMPTAVLAQEWKEDWKVVREDLEGPDYIQPPKHYRTLQMMLAEAGLAQFPIEGPPPQPVSGTREILVILVDFADVTHDPSYTVAYFDDRFFDTTAPSVRDYFTEVSYGTFTYVPGAVLGWYASTYNQSQWYSDPRPVVVEAIQNADPSFDFAPYDTDSSGTVTNDELTIFIIYPGTGQSFHWWTSSSVATADGVSVEGEFSTTREGQKIGTYCHELGHDLGLPDLYDTDPGVTGDSVGIGNYGLMGGGSATFSHMTAWSKIQLGWITPTVVTSNGYYDVHDAETNAEAYVLIDTTHSSDEYFLVENRYPKNSYYETVGPPVAPSGTLPDEGIVIYHIDEAQVQDWITYGINNVNADETRKGVDVETAEHPTSHVVDADDLDAAVNWGDGDDLWDNGEYDFDDSSTPCNANWYTTTSGMGVSEFPAVSPTMQVYFTLLQAPTLISPGDGAILDNNCADRSDSIEWDFDWSDVTGATQYNIYVIRDGAIYPAIDTIVSSSSYHYSNPGGYIIDTNRFNWTWMVRAGNGNGQWSDWSEVRYFDVEPLSTDCDTLPSCPELYSWNGEDFVYEDHTFYRTHSPEEEYDHIVPIKAEVVPKEDGLVFKIVETGGEKSFINKVELYFTEELISHRSMEANINDCEEEMNMFRGVSSIDEVNGTELVLRSAVHSVLGDVSERLTEDDESRVEIFPGEVILLTFQKPPEGITPQYLSVSSGYYLFGGYRRAVAVTPANIDFGSIKVGNRDPTAEVTISNTKDTDLTVRAISDPEAPFSLDGVPDLPIAIPAGGSESFVISFSPTAEGDFSRTVNVSTEDGNQPEVDVLLSGTGVTSGDVSTEPESGGCFIATACGWQEE